MELKPGNPCSNCKDGGCEIYENRPIDPCISFKCAWLKYENILPDDMRPDLSGAIVMLDRKFGENKIISAVSTSPDMPKDTLDRLRKFAVTNKTPLIFSNHPIKDGVFGRSEKTGFGPPAFVEGVKNAVRPDDIIKF